MTPQQKIDEKIDAFDREFLCIATGCDGNGTIPNQVGEGGWEPESHREEYHLPTGMGRRKSLNKTVRASITLEAALLDPLAWQAVGKVEGWKDGGNEEEIEEDEWKPGDIIGPRYLFEMHRMIDSLAEGKTIEQFISTL